MIIFWLAGAGVDGHHCRCSSVVSECADTYNVPLCLCDEVTNRLGADQGDIHAPNLRNKIMC